MGPKAMDRPCDGCLPPARLRRQGFTLVELLIALAIVAFLAGLIAEGALAARRRLDLARCRTNLLQLGVALKLYTADYHAFPFVYYQVGDSGDPPRPPSPPPSYNARQAMGDYLSDADVFRCPLCLRAVGRSRCNDYVFNGLASGLMLSKVREPPSRAWLMCDTWESVMNLGHGKQNCLFMDGHVKAYPWVSYASLVHGSSSFPPRDD